MVHETLNPSKVFSTLSLPFNTLNLSSIPFKPLDFIILSGFIPLFNIDK